MGLPRANRLRKRAEFRRAYDNGRQTRGRWFSLFVLRRDDDGPARFGFTVTRRVGKAVVRNRLRRQLRECARLALGEVERGHDVVVNAYDTALGHKTPAILERWREALRRAGIAGRAPEDCAKKQAR